MSKKDVLLKKLCKHPLPKDFTSNELKLLLKNCNCKELAGGRGSGIRFIHNKSGRILTFDMPHPQKELYIYQIKKTIEFLKNIGEI